MLKKPSSIRLLLLSVVPVLFSVAIASRLYYLQVVSHEKYVAEADRRQKGVVRIMPLRGKILDRNGRELAFSTLLRTAYADPSKLKSNPTVIPEIARDLASVVDTDFDTLLRRMSGNVHSPLARKLEPKQVLAVDQVLAKYRKVIPKDAVYYVQEGKRFYPRNELASNVVGFVTLDETGDNKGLEGLELQYDEELRGQMRRARSRINAVSRALEPIEQEIIESTFGNSIVLTIDETIQSAAEESITRHVQHFGADSGVIVVIAVKTGEILALANCPSYDLNRVSVEPDMKRRNRALTDAIEPGSTMKVFTFACALDEDKVQPQERINCEGGRWHIHGRTIVDTHKAGVVPVAYAFKHSSNVASVKAALRLTPQRMHDRLRAFGFGSPTGIDLPGEGSGIFRDTKEWSVMTMSSLPQGYEIQVTAIQMAAAMAAIGNKGIYLRPHVVREIRDYRGDTIRRMEPDPVRRVASSLTCQKMLEMMEYVVLEGTGKHARLKHYRAAGKTGTTKKWDNETKTYNSRAYIGSFLGVAPAENPEISVYVYIDNPKSNVYYGGHVAAPVFREVAEVALRTMKVPPSSMEAEGVPLERELERVRDRIAKTDAAPLLEPAPPDDELTPGVMPRLEGLTMAEAREALTALGIPFEFAGSGVVLDQRPRPYVTIEPTDRAVITFGAPRRLVERLVAESRPVRDSRASAVATDGDAADSEALQLVAGTDVIDIPVQAENASRPVSPRARATPAVERGSQRVPLPDLDDAARRSAERGAWDRWRDNARRAGAGE